MTEPTPSTSRIRIQSLILALATSAAVLGGCSKNDEAKEAVSAAGTEFRKVSIGDSTHSEAFSSDAYLEAERMVSEYAGNETPYGEAAAVTVALSKLGMATLASGDASDAESEASHQARIIRAYLSEWFAMNAVAKASVNFDVTEDKAALQKLITMRTEDVVQYTQLMESLQGEIDGLQSQIDDLDAKVVTERNDSARFELQMTGVSATKAAQLAERVREHSLRADSYELESVRLQGRVGQLRPGAHEIELQVQKAKDQIALLKSSIEELDQRVRDSKADSAQARAKAQQTQSKLVELLDKLESYRAETADPATQKVISQIRQSLTASREANNAAKVSGTLAKASAHEHLARTLSRQARGVADIASLYQSLQESGIPGDWDTKLHEHTTTRDDLYAQAHQAFQDGASALRSVRARGETGESLEAAAVRLDRLGGVEPEPEYNEDYEDDNADSADNEG